ncbi:unnamed protein product [Calypogeia fissa]
MVAEAELNVSELQETVALLRTCHDFHPKELDCGILRKVQADMSEVMANWRAKQAEKQSQNLELQQQVALAERRLVSAKMDGSNNEEFERVKEQLAQAQAREKQMQADVKDLEDCIVAIEEQMLSIKLQKDTLEKPDAEEAFLKNELSLFLNVSSILPDLGDPKFSGTFVDKHRGVKTFKFLSTEMSPFETCNHAWDMMR